ncbi:MAG: EcoRI family type II restriction endonuclease [Thermoguttaceae bacterium]
MARKHQLREQRTGTVINLTSKQQEGRLGRSLTAVAKRLHAEFGVELHHDRQWKLADVVRRLREAFPNVPFHYHFESSAMRPDGGILSIRDKSGNLFPVLIVEVKNQGTNDLREAEGKPRQAKGNAIERLGKNVIGFRTAMLNEGIIPFVCFGDGCDFADSSSILDRVVTIGMFGPLNRIQVVNDGEQGQFNRGSFYFRAKPWTSKEMESVMYEIAERSIHHYYAKYGKASFPGAK